MAALNKDQNLNGPFSSDVAPMVTGRFLTLGMLVVALSAAGCSGLVTGSLTGNLLPEDAVLPAEADLDEPLVVPSSNDDDSLNKLVVESALLAETPQANQVLSVDDESNTFRFTHDLPEEPAFAAPVKESDFVGEVTSPAGVSKGQSGAETVTLVARAEPLPMREAFHPASIGIAQVSTGKELSPLKPIVTKAERPLIEARVSSETEVDPPSLSAADLKQVTHAVIETPAMAANEMLDLSELELESALATVPPKDTSISPPAEQSPMTATEHLAETIRLVKKSTASGDFARTKRGTNVAVRFLTMLQRKLDVTTDAEWTLSDDERKYWQQQLDAVAVMLETEPVSVDESLNQKRRESSQQAIRHLEDAANHLRAISGLQVRDGQLCSEIRGFGQYKLLDSNEFNVGDRALVYLEVENYLSVRQPAEPSTGSRNGMRWRTRLQTSYAIHNQNGQIVQQEKYPVIEDKARRRRTDFYLHLPLAIPALPAGKYELKVEVEDLARSDSATLGPIPFAIR